MRSMADPTCAGGNAESATTTRPRKRLSIGGLLVTGVLAFSTWYIGTGLVTVVAECIGQVAR